MNRAVLGLIWLAILALGLALIMTPMLGARAHAAAVAVAAPDQLPAEARGVVGSGDQLSLQLRTPGGADRAIKVGEVYKDGWTLQALTPTKATLAKGGVVREVGLNPTGALASSAPAAAPSSVTLVGVPDDAAVQRILDRRPGLPAGAPVAVQPGLTAAESRRSAAYLELISEEMRRGALISMTTIHGMLGEAAFTDYAALNQKAADGYQAAVAAGTPPPPLAPPP